MVFTKTSFGFEVCGVVIAGLLMPGTAGLVHVMEAPGVLLPALYVNIELLQIASGESVVLRVGVGLTLTVTLCVLLHPFAVMVNR